MSYPNQGNPKPMSAAVASDYVRQMNRIIADHYGEALGEAT